MGVEMRQTPGATATAASVDGAAAGPAWPGIIRKYGLAAPPGTRKSSGAHAGGALRIAAARRVTVESTAGGYNDAHPAPDRSPHTGGPPWTPNPSARCSTSVRACWG